MNEVPGSVVPTDTQEFLGWQTWARLVPRRANLGVKLTPIIWDPGHGTEPLFTSVSMPVKWGNESCYLRGLWGPHRMAIKQVPQPLSQA